MSVHVIDEASRCLQCPNPRCRENGCPIHTDIPKMIRLFKENRMMEAAERRAEELQQQQQQIQQQMQQEQLEAQAREKQLEME